MRKCKKLKGATIENLEDASVIWIGQVNARNGTATDKVIKQRAKALGEQIGVINFVALPPLDIPPLGKGNTSKMDVMYLVAEPVHSPEVW
jgi:hypothetical protein